jgi:hypothetical protein
MGRKILFIFILVGISFNTNGYRITFKKKEVKTITLEGTTFNDNILADGFKPTSNRFKGKRIVALDRKFIKDNNLMNKTLKVTIEYITKKGNILKQDSIIVKDKINPRFRNKRIDFFDNKANPNSDNIGKVTLFL